MYLVRVLRLKLLSGRASCHTNTKFSTAVGPNLVPYGPTLKYIYYVNIGDSEAQVPAGSRLV